jgi:hypothetical protein
LRRYVLFLLVAGIAVILAAVIAYEFHLNPHEHPAKAMVVALGIVPSYLLYRVLNGFYQNKSKTYLMDKIAESLDFTFHPDGAFTVGDIVGHKILPGAGSVSAYDGLSGTYRDLRVDIEGATLNNLAQIPNAADPRREMRNFEGILVRLRFGRTLPAHTVMIPAAAQAAFFAGSFADYRQFAPAHEAFEQNYVALSTDTVEGKFSLSPSFAEHFMEAGKAMGAKWGAASFEGSEILFVMQCLKPIFPVSPLWRPALPAPLHRFAGEMDALFRLIDTVKSNSQLGI